MTVRENKDSLIDNVMNLSDMENLIVATFIAGMQAKKVSAEYKNTETERPHKPSKNRPA